LIWLDVGSILLEWYEEIETYEVIPYLGLAIVVGSGGLYLFDYTDLGDIRLVSSILTG
jgi:hypothetical protein